MFNTSKIVFSEGGFKVILSDVASVEVRALLRENVLGTSGPRYQHLNTDERIDNLHQATYFTLVNETQLLGVCVYCKRTVQLVEKSFDGYYIRYFAVPEASRGNGYGKLLMNAIAEYYHDIIDEPSIFYAYIEEKNLASMNVSKRFEKEPISEMRDIFFSRFFPKKIRGVEALSLDEKDMFLLAYRKQKSSLCLRHELKLGYQEQYYVLKEEGEIIAGVQANFVQWRFDNMPGGTGKLIMNVLPRVPFFRKLFNPRNFKFIAFDSLYCKLGHENKILPLLESVCAKTNHNTSIVWLDTKDAHYKYLREQKNLGFMSSFGGHRVNVIANYINIDQEVIETLKKQPTYISSFDMT